MPMLWRGRHTFSGHATFKGGVTGAIPALGNGKTFWVDNRSWGVGSDTNSGTDPNYPFATIAKALTLCTSGNEDYIIVLASYDLDTSSIQVVVPTTHIIGVGSKNHRAMGCWLNTGADSVFTLQGSNSSVCEIAGFAMCADTSHPCITTKTGASTELVYAWIHDCQFAASLDAAFVAQDGILEADGTGLDGTLIEDCTFGDEITRDGIRFTNFYGGLIRNCLFDNCGSKAIDAITGGASTGMPDVIGNFFRANHGAAEGWAITTISSGNGLIAFNHASADFATADYNPYLDHDDLNQWCMNYTVAAVTAPATT